MEHKPHFARQTNKDLPTGNTHIKDHIIKYENGEVVSRCDQYYKKLAELHGQNPTATQKDNFFINHFKLISDHHGKNHI